MDSDKWFGDACIKRTVWQEHHGQLIQAFQLAAISLHALHDLYGSNFRVIP